MSSKLDFPQIIKRVYDEVTDSLKTTPSTATSFSIELDAADGDSVSIRPLATDTVTLFNAISAGADNTTASVNILNDRGYAAQYSWSGLTGTLDGTLQLQASLDDSIWTNVSAGLATLSSASGSFLFDSGNVNYKFFRVVYTKNGITGGSVTIKYVKKG